MTHSPTLRFELAMLGSRDRHNVVRVAACSARTAWTDVMQFATIRDWTVFFLIHEAVRRNIAIIARRVSISGFFRAAMHPAPSFGVNVVKDASASPRVMATDKTNRAPFDDTFATLGVMGNRGSLPATTLTQTKGDGNIFGHGVLQTLCRAPGAGHLHAGVSAVHNSTRIRATVRKKAATPRIIERTQAILRRHQTGG